MIHYTFLQYKYIFHCSEGPRSHIKTYNYSIIFLLDSGINSVFSVHLKNLEPIHLFDILGFFCQFFGGFVFFFVWLLALFWVGFCCHCLVCLLVCCGVFFSSQLTDLIKLPIWFSKFRIPLKLCLFIILGIVCINTGVEAILTKTYEAINSTSLLLLIQ